MAEPMPSTQADRAPQAADRQLAELAAFVHGVLAAFHLLGIMYNVKKRNWWDVTAHTLAATYDIHAMHGHLEDVQLLKETQP